MRRVNGAVILAIETALPNHSIAQGDAAVVAQNLGLSKRWNHAMPKLYARSSVERRGSVLLDGEVGLPIERQSFYRAASEAEPLGPTTAERMVVYAQHAGPMLVEACRRALYSAKTAPKSVTHLITISCTGFSAPGVDFEVIRRLDLSPSVQRTHIGFMGCHAALNGLNVARNIIAADPSAVVLLGAVELCSLHQQYTDDPQQLVANSLFADGAAAVILVGQRFPDSDDDFDAEPPSDFLNYQVRSNYSFVVPSTAEMMSWTIGDHGFRMSLDPQVPSIIEGRLRYVLEGWLDEHKIALSDIDGWAIHPGGPRIVESVGRALGLIESDLAPSLSILANHGNMSSPTVLFIIKSLMEFSSPPKRILTLAFGPGLCIEACLLVASPPTLSGNSQP